MSMLMLLKSETQRVRNDDVSAVKFT